MTFERGKTLTGARCRFLLNGVLCGYGESVSATETIQHEPVQPVGTIEVAEHTPVAYRVSVRMSFYRLLGKDLKTQGLFPRTGNTPEEHLRNILNTADFTLVVEDVTGRIVGHVEGVRIEEKTINFQQGSVSKSDATMVARRIREEGDFSA